MREFGVFALLLLVTATLSAGPAPCCPLSPAQNTLAGMRCADPGCCPAMRTNLSDRTSSLTPRAPAAHDAAQTASFLNERAISFPPTPKPDGRNTAAPAFLRFGPLLV